MFCLQRSEGSLSTEEQGGGAGEESGIFNIEMAQKAILEEKLLN